MKLFSPESWMGRLFGSGKRAGQLKLLRQQRVLLHSGIESTAEVMDMSLFDGGVGSLLPVRLWLKLKKTDGSFIYTHTHSLVTLKHIPAKGEILRIKYLPDNLSAILIL